MRILPASAYARTRQNDLPDYSHCDSRSVWHRSEDTFLVTGNNDKLTITELDAAIRIGRESDLVELLALTACQTAVGDDRAALGLAGVAVQAGQNALASLWFIKMHPL